MTDAGLTCREVLDLFTDYLDGALAPVVRARVVAHLDGCDACRRYLDQFTASIDMTAALREESIPDDVRGSLPQGIQNLAPARDLTCNARRSWRTADQHTATFEEEL